MSREILESAIQLHRQGQLAEALALYQSVLDKEPNNPDALQLAGVVAHRLGQSARAIDLMRRSLAMNANQPNVLFNLGNCHLALGQIDDAIVQYEQALRLDPTMTHAAQALWEGRIRHNRVRTLVITSSDTGFFPLAQDLVQSLRADRAERHPYDIAFLDCGCTQAELAWMRQSGVIVGSVLDGPALRIDGHPLHTMAQSCRPHLPTYFPGYDVYIWFDADIWVQMPNTISDLIDQACLRRSGMVAVRETDSHYFTLTDSSAAQTYFADYHQRLVTFCPPDLLSRLYLIPQYNCGVFAMHSTSAGWQEWANQVHRSLVGGYFRMFEQYAFNAAIAQCPGSVTLDSRYNWISSQCTPQRQDSGLVCKPYFPYDPIHVVHLTATSQMCDGRRFLDVYRERKLLFRS